MGYYNNWLGKKSSLGRRTKLFRSKRKTCICGGHNANNPKANLNHNSTKSKLSIRLNRIFKRKTNGTN